MPGGRRAAGTPVGCPWRVLHQHVQGPWARGLKGALRGLHRPPHRIWCGPAAALTARRAAPPPHTCGPATADPPPSRLSRPACRRLAGNNVPYVFRSSSSSPSRTPGQTDKSLIRGVICAGMDSPGKVREGRPAWPRAPSPHPHPTITFQHLHRHRDGLVAGPCKIAMASAMTTWPETALPKGCPGSA